MTSFYGETICVGVDMLLLMGRKPKGISDQVWEEKYNGFWFSYIESLGHRFLGTFTVYVGDGTSIVFGTRMEYYLDNYGNISYNRYKALLAKEIGRVLDIDLEKDDIRYFATNYIIDIQ